VGTLGWTDVAGVAALLALLLLPGLLVVRASWTAVPFLSAAFWIVSWWWLPSAAGRRHFVLVTLAGCASLALLRLLKPLAVSRPSWPVVLVLAAVLARLAPFVLWPAGPDDRMALQALSSLLMIWHDGVPATYEPLLPVRGFGADGTGIEAVAADVALLSGLAAPRAALLAGVVAGGLLLIALYALLRQGHGRPRAAVAAVLGLGLMSLPRPALASIGADVLLATAFLAAAVSLLVRGHGRAPAFAAGMFLAAAFESEPALAIVVVASAAVLAWRVTHLSAAERRLWAERWTIAVVFGFGLAAPFLWRAGLSLDASHGLRASLAGAAILLAPWLVAAVARRTTAGPRVALAILAAASMVGLWREASGAGIEPPVDSAQLETMAWIGSHTSALDVVCTDPSRATAWIPAFTGRRVYPAPVPRAYASALRSMAAPACALNLSDKR
jgi:hypothetical protein